MKMITTFKLKEGAQPVTVEALVRALNAHLRAIGLEPDEYDYCVSPRIAYSDPQVDQHLPKKYRWLVAFAIEGGSEGYYIHVGAVDDATATYTDLGFAKTYSPENAYAIARETQRFLTAAEWN